MHLYIREVTKRYYCSLVKSQPCVHHHQFPTWNRRFGKVLNQQTAKSGECRQTTNEWRTVAVTSHSQHKIWGKIPNKWGTADYITSNSPCGIWGQNQALEFPTKWGIVIWITSSSQHETKDSIQVRHWPISSGAQQKKERISKLQGTYPWPSEMTRKTEISESAHGYHICVSLESTTATKSVKRQNLTQ